MRATDLTDLMQQRQVPQMALVVYKNDRTHQLYIESHRINPQGKMLAGIPLTLKCVTELIETFSAEQTNRQPDIPHGIIPPNLLYADTRKGNERYIWYNPPRKRMMFFKSTLNIENREYFLPGILYRTNGERLDICAFKEEKPEADTLLYKAPLFNVTDESVCLGVAHINRPNNPTFDELIHYWERKFWNTEFSHLGGSRNPTRNNLVTVTNRMTHSFDNDELILFEKQKGIPLTLKDILKQ